MQLLQETESNAGDTEHDKLYIMWVSEIGVKLTDDDIRVRENKTSDYRVIIQRTTSKECYRIKQQILENESITERLKERMEELGNLMLTEHPLEHIGGCEYKQRLKELQSIYKGDKK